MLTTLGLLLFWGAIGLALYSYIGFPVLLFLRAVLRPQSVLRGDATPSVSIVIAAYNEVDVIKRKLDNTLALDYPQAVVQVIVASDGSDDGTNEAVLEYASPQVTLLPLPRMGKNRALNAGVAAASGDLLLFTDADSILDKDALIHLTAPFSDPHIGGVIGDYYYATDVEAGKGERTYWGYDRLLKHWQTRSGNVTSATGQLYAIRREFFRPIPPGVTDDFFTSVQVPAALQRLIFEPKAIARGPIAGSAEAEFRRKVRVITCGLTGVWQMRQLWNPFEYEFYAVQLVTHKLLRRLMAIPLLMLFVSAPLLWQQGWVYQWLTIGQAAFHGTALIGYLVRNTRLGQNRLISLPFYFDMVYAASLVALSNLLRGHRFDMWTAERADVHAFVSSNDH